MNFTLCEWVFPGGPIDKDGAVMLPIVLNPEKIGVILAGRGDAVLRRLDKLAEDGVQPRAVFSDAPVQALVDRVGVKLHHRLPRAEDLAGTQILYLVDLQPI